MPCVHHSRASEHPVIIEADGAVVRSVTGSLAVEFTSLDPDSYHHLRQVIINNAMTPNAPNRNFSPTGASGGPCRSVGSATPVR